MRDFLILKETPHGCYVKRLRNARKKTNVKKYIQFLNRSKHDARYTYVGKHTRRKKQKAEKIAHKKNTEIYEKQARTLKHGVI